MGLPSPDTTKIFANFFIKSVAYSKIIATFAKDTIKLI